jgi:hypothetical protein
VFSKEWTFDRFVVGASPAILRLPSTRFREFNINPSESITAAFAIENLGSVAFEDANVISSCTGRFLNTLRPAAEVTTGSKKGGVAHESLKDSSDNFFHPLIH